MQLVHTNRNQGPGTYNKAEYLDPLPICYKQGRIILILSQLKKIGDPFKRECQKFKGAYDI